MLNFVDWLRNRSPLGRTATKLYGSIVTQARHPVLYGDYGAADTPEARYELVVLHLIIVLQGLRALGASSDDEAFRMRQALVEAFVRDLDGSMREMAVGDTSVPRKVKKAAGGLFDRDTVYREAFESADHDVLPALLRELIAGDNGQVDIPRLTAYARLAWSEIVKAGSGERLVEGEIDWPDPAIVGDRTHD